MLGCTGAEPLCRPLDLLEAGWSGSHPAYPSGRRRPSAAKPAGLPVAAGQAGSVSRGTAIQPPRVICLEQVMEDGLRHQALAGYKPAPLNAFEQAIG